MKIKKRSEVLWYLCCFTTHNIVEAFANYISIGRESGARGGNNLRYGDDDVQQVFLKSRRLVEKGNKCFFLTRGEESEWGHQNVFFQKFITITFKCPQLTIQSKEWLFWIFIWAIRHEELCSAVSLFSALSRWSGHCKNNNIPVNHNVQISSKDFTDFFLFLSFSLPSKRSAIVEESSESVCFLCFLGTLPERVSFLSFTFTTARPIVSCDRTLQAIQKILLTFWSAIFEVEFQKMFSERCWTVDSLIIALFTWAVWQFGYLTKIPSVTFIC